MAAKRKNSTMIPGMTPDGPPMTAGKYQNPQKPPMTVTVNTSITKPQRNVRAHPSKNATTTTSAPANKAKIPNTKNIGGKPTPATYRNLLGM